LSSLRQQAQRVRILIMLYIRDGMTYTSGINLTVYA